MKRSEKAASFRHPPDPLCRHPREKRGSRFRGNESDGHIDAVMQVGESVETPVLVVAHALPEPTCDAGVKRSAIAVGEEPAAGRGQPKRGPRFREGDGASWKDIAQKACRLSRFSCLAARPLCRARRSTAEPD